MTAKQILGCGKRFTFGFNIYKAAMDYEADRLEQRIDMVTNETLDATRRMRQVAEETNQIGVDTLVTLNEQGEQLENVENRLDTIGADLKGKVDLRNYDVIFVYL